MSCNPGKPKKYINKKIKGQDMKDVFGRYPWIAWSLYINKKNNPGDAKKYLLIFYFLTLQGYTQSLYNRMTRIACLGKIRISFSIKQIIRLADEGREKDFLVIRCVNLTKSDLSRYPLKIAGSVPSMSPTFSSLLCKLIGWALVSSCLKDLFFLLLKY